MLAPLSVTTPVPACRIPPLPPVMFPERVRSPAPVRESCWPFKSIELVISGSLAEVATENAWFAFKVIPVRLICARLPTVSPPSSEIASPAIRELVMLIVLNLTVVLRLLKLGESLLKTRLSPVPGGPMGDQLNELDQFGPAPPVQLKVVARRAGTDQKKTSPTRNEQARPFIAVPLPPFYRTRREKSKPIPRSGVA